VSIRRGDANAAARSHRVVGALAAVAVLLLAMTALNAVAIARLTAQTLEEALV
jgi:hypothetical protein